MLHGWPAKEGPRLVCILWAEVHASLVPRILKRMAAQVFRDPSQELPRSGAARALSEAGLSLISLISI